MGTTISQHVELDATLSRIEEHLNGARAQLSKYREVRAQETARESESRPAYFLSAEEKEARTAESIARRRAKNTLISELKEALEAAHNLPGDPMF